MRKLKPIVVVLFLTICSIVHGQFKTKNESFELVLNKKGEVTHLVDRKNNINYAAKEAAYLVHTKIGGNFFAPINFKVKEEKLVYTFENSVEVEINWSNQKTHFRFEISSISGVNEVEAIVWGPFKTTISQTIGDFVGVVRNDDYAIGIQALNVKTTGGELKNDEGTVYSRGSAAVKQDYGSSIQAFTIDHTQPQEIEVWNGFKKTQIVANSEYNLIGSAIALFGVQESEALETIGKIEVKEGLPHIMFEGEWVKNSAKSRRPYIISNFGEESIDDMLNFTQKVGFYSLYQSHPFSNWGHFNLIPKLFPNGRDGMKFCVEKAKARNIYLGVHTLTNFITTNDPYVTPIPHNGLAVFAKTKIINDIDVNSDEITIINPELYDKKTTLQTVRIGDELIRFSGVTKSAPFKLTECKRGSFGTVASEHKGGSSITRLVDHPYKTFYPDMNLQDEIIDNLIDFFNETGVSHLDFDGHEGAFSTGYGDSSKDHFALRFIEGVNHNVINGTGRSGHFYWHINTYMNWGEPWYGGMKESHNDIRFNNQAILERNYQPNMLGWFWYNRKTTVEEMDWVLARAAGWDAGYALVVNPEDIKNNPIVETVIRNIRIWEEAKNLGIFNDEQKGLLKAGENDFSLMKTNDDEFHLQYYAKKKFTHENIVLQPGQPNYSEWEFKNETVEQLLNFKLKAEGDDGVVSNVVLEMDGYHTLELKAGYSCIFNGSESVLVYDDKGRLKRKQKIDFEGLKIDKGDHTIRVSCEYSNEDLELKAEIKLKDKVDIITI